MRLCATDARSCEELFAAWQAMDDAGTGDKRDCAGQWAVGTVEFGTLRQMYVTNRLLFQSGFKRAMCGRTCASAVVQRLNTQCTATYGDPLVKPARSGALGADDNGMQGVAGLHARDTLQGPEAPLAVDTVGQPDTAFVQSLAASTRPDPSLVAARIERESRRNGVSLGVLSYVLPDGAVYTARCLIDAKVAAGGEIVGLSHWLEETRQSHMNP